MRNVALLVAEVLVLLVLLEIGVRVVVPDQVDVPHLRVFPEGYYTWFPGARFTYHNLPDVLPPSAEIEINEHGLRDDALPAEKPAGEIRVLVLGDSFTAAVQLPREHIFTTLLERDLNRGEPTPRYRVVNAGFNGAGTAHELLYFEHQGSTFAPDVVILQYAFNDLEDSLAHGGFRVTQDGLELAAAFRNPPFWRGPLLRLRDGVGNRSLAFYLLYKALKDAGAAGDMAGVANAADPPTASARPGVVLIQHLAARLIADANALGAPVIVLTLPSPARFAGGDADYDAVVAALRTLVASTANQLIVANQTLLESHRRGDPVCLAFDGHLNERGHELVAGLLEKAVRKSARTSDGPGPPQ